ncbi:CAP domain-containing protein [Mesorhizobium sp. Root157]|uniref:CAP domain-containing protein n=1 Tax=Mesorhizobium sp. Root157 TaxID=1736477 RepID=UPI000B335F50|nr:CAP domain-containing protein [Mesorhizobium sp. Root157]
MTGIDSKDLASNTAFHQERRTFIIGLGLLTVLAGCGTVAPIGSGAGASNSAADTLGRIRSAAGRSGLAPDNQLERAALQQAGYMAGAKRMTHTTGWRKDFASRVDGNDIKGAAAENIAEGRMDIRRLFEMWMDSPPHRRNILDARFTRFGLAYVRDGKNPEWRYWALLLGK